MSALGEAIWRVAYDGLALPIARALLPVAGVLHPKLAAWRGERVHWQAVLDAALARRPDLSLGDAVWVHGASAGEFLQARALLAALRSARPEVPLVYTYTSPSARPLLEGFRGADLVFPLPLDTRANARAWLDRIRPAALALIDAELWPNVVRESAARGIPVALVSARHSGDSARWGFPLRHLYRAVHERLTLVACVDEATAASLGDAGVAAAALRVTGDLRVDETLRRARASEPPDLPLPAMLPAVVAGSTWRGDEDVLLQALEELRDRGVLLTAVIAPHEVTERRVHEVERRLDEHGFTTARWSRLVTPTDLPSPPERGGDPVFVLGAAETSGSRTEASAAGGASLRIVGALSTSRVETAEAAVVDAIVVDRVGILHRLYARAAVAWVGGAFRGRVHNLMEPAAHGVPVLCGPETGRSWIARDLTAACALFPVADREACVAALGHLLTDGGSARVAGDRGRAVLERHAGAARRTVEALEEVAWLPQTPAEAGEART